jgi:FkbM family methyltransferase
MVRRLQSFVAGHASTAHVVRRLTEPMREGVHTIARGPAAGMRMNVAGSRPSYLLGTAEPELVDFLVTNIGPGDVVIDLGANVGYFTLVAAALTGPTGRVIAVEPLPENLAALRRNVTLNELTHVEVIDAAVSAREGTAALTVGGTNQSSSIVLEDRGSSAISVDTVTIDGLVERYGVRPALIKMDIEGAEEDAVEGGRSTLAEMRPTILCELHVDRPTFDSPVPRALAAAGYDLGWLESAAYDQDVFWAPHLVAQAPRDD